MTKIITILGTRPEIIKLSPVLPLLEQKFHNVIVHTGQHYSPELDAVFFEELKLRKPDYNLHVGSGSHGTQLGKMLNKLQEVVDEEKPDLILVQGDTNSTLAGALIAAKSSIPLVHIEAGYRSGNIKMPEEVNRIIADRFSSTLFLGTEQCLQNVQQEGISSEKCLLVGNTVVDALHRTAQFATKEYLKKYGLEENGYILATIHRAENTEKENLSNILESLGEVARSKKIVFPIHPRTKAAIEKFNISVPEGVVILEPEGYVGFISLLKHASFVMTDSGGVQEESVELNVPCLILRNETELKELLAAGKTILVSNKKEKIIQHAQNLLDSPEEVIRIKNIPFQSKRGVAEKIVNIMKEVYAK